jgi:hypothetical protein
MQGVYKESSSNIKITKHDEREAEKPTYDVNR